MKRLFCFLMLSAGLIAHPSFSQQSVKVNCKDEPWMNRYTDNEVRNKLLTDACAHIYNNQYDSAKVSLQKALDISDDAYFQNILEKLNAALRDQHSGITDASAKPGSKENVIPVPAVKAQPANTTTPGPSNTGSTTSGGTKNTEPIKSGGPSQTTGASTSDPSGTSKTLKSSGVSTSPVTESASEANTSVKLNKEITSKTGDVDDKAFTASELEDFRLKGKQKVADLERYIQKISDRKYSQSETTNDINNALKLFDKEEHYVQVSSLNRPDKPKYLVRKYLEKVRALNYDNVKIEWAELQYTSKFRLAPDGNYYGFIKFRQRYTAMRGGEIAYQDVTNKVISVILKPKHMAIEGSKKDMFEVFLGDIEVVQTFKR